MDGLIAQLQSENDPRARSAIKKMLVREEDQLGNDFELLARLDKHIQRGNELIAWHNVRLHSMDHNGNAQAKALLDRLMDSQDLLERRRKAVLTSIGRNKL